MTDRVSTERLEVEPGALLGDGVFETIHLRAGGPWLLDAHLDRLFASAAVLELTLPPRPEIVDRVLAVATGFDDGALRILATRSSLHVTASDISSTMRRGGIRLLTADIGFDLGRRPPWSLSGIKSLSYAENFAARRWATRQGADDVLFCSSDGYALESPTASLVWLTGDELATVPAAAAQILPGVTVAALLAQASSVGLRPVECLVTIDELRSADAIWLASSLRGLAEATALDGTPRPPSPWTSRLQSLLGFPT